ncbi:hypothetical protein L0F51_00120 [Afifella sp. H1R]|uniref:hypothetical protein n=1 Tax=Afifella sp. H1R TaxID=2908841 RepID=UPI001F17ECBC|nr:hypothetical protein [Afifella sp. H1R]MCF1502171.1 hypothetical protein [Afifella sp. H1R]
MEGLAAFLRRIHPISTAMNVEADTGISARTIEGWLELRSRPSFANGLVMVGVYGPEFLAAAAHGAPDWLSEAGRQQRIDQLKAEEEALRERRRALEGA